MRHMRLINSLRLGVILCLALVSAAPAQNQSEDNSVEFVTLPAGTQVKINVEQPDPTVDAPLLIPGKVSVPVRRGFSTVIPALSIGTVQFTPARYGNSYRHRRRIDVAELTSVMVNDSSYNVRTDSVPLVFGTPGTDTEITFTLTEPVQIHR